MPCMATTTGMGQRWVLKVGSNDDGKLTMLWGIVAGRLRCGVRGVGCRR